VAALIYWIAFSAYKRGVSPAQRSALLVHAADHAKGSFHEEAIIKDLWDEEYDFVTEHYKKKLKAYADAWLDSEAAEAYKEYRNEKAYLPGRFTELIHSAAKVKGPGPITAIHLTSWSAPESDEKHGGIVWDIGTMYDVFSIIMNQIMSNEFVLGKIDSPHSWANRWMRVATTHLVDFINLGLAQGQRAHLYNQDKNLLESLSRYTTPGLPNGRFTTPGLPNGTFPAVKMKK